MKVVHCSKTKCTHYCGRKSSIHKALGEPEDLSILCNPEPLAFEGDRENNLKRYTHHLVNLCESNPIIIEILLAIPDDSLLGCFCAPKLCHCNVIIDAKRFYKSKHI